MKFTYKEWCRLYADVAIIADPDGWDRFKPGEGERLISQEEFEVRMCQSTILSGKRFEELFIKDKQECTVKHSKTGRYYYVVGTAKNCTNAQNGQNMIIYTSGYDPDLYVRYEEEFWKKFEKIL